VPTSFLLFPLKPKKKRAGVIESQYHGHGASLPTQIKLLLIPFKVMMHL
jgi:hypothetical protein